MRHSRRLEAIAQMADSSTHANWPCLNIEFTCTLWSVFFLIVLCSCSCNMLKDSHTNDLSCATQSGLGIFVVLKESWKPSIGFTWFHLVSPGFTWFHLVSPFQHRSKNQKCAPLGLQHSWLWFSHLCIHLIHLHTPCTQLGGCSLSLLIYIVCFNENTCDQ